jgi:hypothetical protein
LGFDTTGRLLETVVLVFESGHQLVIHAMPARKKYLDLLPWRPSRNPGSRPTGPATAHRRSSPPKGRRSSPPKGVRTGSGATGHDRGRPGSTTKGLPTPCVSVVLPRTVHRITDRRKPTGRELVTCPGAIRRPPSAVGVDHAGHPYAESALARGAEHGPGVGVTVVGECTDGATDGLGEQRVCCAQADQPGDGGVCPDEGAGHWSLRRRSARAARSSRST